MPEVDADDWRPTASWNNLRLRSQLLRRLRAFFERRDFLEVETPILSHDVVIDRHLEPFAIVSADQGPCQPRLWLQTSPEFGMKRLMAAGGEAIFQVTRAFRDGEQGPLHNPEFTIVEWYRRGDGMEEGMQFLSDLCQEMLELGPARKMTYREAFERHAGVNPHEASIERLLEAARLAGLVPPPGAAGYDGDAWLDWLLVELVEPNLGVGEPVLLHHYPASQAALAKIDPGPPATAARFELYVRGVELANGYHELLDPHVLCRRNQDQNRARLDSGKPQLPEASRLLDAMQAGLPQCTGVAMGFDRLAMLAAGASSVADVLAFPFNRA